MLGQKSDQLHHVAISVDDLENAINWYTSNFSCQIYYQDRQHAFLAFNESLLELVLPSFQPAHLAFTRKDANLLGELTEVVPGIKSTFISDSSGNLVEIVAPPGNFATQFPNR